MADQQLYDFLLECEAEDDPRKWHQGFKRLRDRIAGRRSLSAVHPELASSVESEIKPLMDMTAANLSGKAFNSWLYSDPQHTVRVMEPEKAEHTLYLNREDDHDYYFTGLNFTGSAFENTIFRGCHFESNNMSRIKASHSVYAGCRFNSPESYGAVLEHADLRESHFHQCLIARTNFPHTDLSGATFSQCYLDNQDAMNYPAYAMFRDANLTDVKFLHCDLTKCDITRKQLEQCGSIEGSILRPDLETVREAIELEIEHKHRKAEHMRSDEPPPAPETITDRIHNYEYPLVPHLDTATQWGEAEGNPKRYRYMLADAMQEVRENLEITGKQAYADAVFASFARRVVMDAGLAGRADGEALEAKIIAALVSGQSSPGLGEPGVEVAVDPVKPRSSPTGPSF